MAVEMDVYTTPPCMVCKMTTTLWLPAKGIDKYNAGELVQVAFPDQDADVREMVKTGIHPDCWDSIFGGEDEM